MTDDRKTLNPGAVKGGDGSYIFHLGEMTAIRAGEAVSTGTGPVVEGERIQTGLIHKAAGTGSHPHSHPNEQWNYIVKGRLRVMIDGCEEVCGPRTLLYFPANVVHATVALPDEDVQFFVVKDMSHSIQGIPADGVARGGYVESGTGE
ncbi:MAG: cupin domain-containing protein [Alphaproteobacteria bacterium]